ncbi:MAG: hypothetical protein KDC24_01365, partial [Saprospiraceae bacterium]|nr:hypothetical protein [Saprospiraceae bacterium]
MNKAIIESNEYGTLFSRLFSLSIENPANLGKATPPLYISQNREFPEHANKLLVLITNISGRPIIIPKSKTSSSAQHQLPLVNYDEPILGENEFRKIDSVFWSFGLDFSDLLFEADLPDISLYIKGDKEDFKAELVDKLDGYPGKIWSLKYKNTVKDYVIEDGDVIEILVENIKVFQRPSLRYIDFYFRDSETKETLELIQYSVLLKRPAYYAAPFFPLVAYWMDGIDSVYISKIKEEENASETTKLKGELSFDNELRFAISNIGQFPLELDCRMDIRESPYFELVVLGEGNHSNPGFLMKREGIKDIQLKIDNDGYGNIWTHQKQIQGPVVTWRIQPVKEGFISRGKTIMGVEEKGTISFSLNGIETTGDSGVSMIYLRYYNIPDFDNGQLVLFVQKKNPKGNVPPAAIWKELGQDGSGKFHPPLSWEIVPDSNGATTHVSLGESKGATSIAGGIIEIRPSVTPSLTTHVKLGESNGATSIAGGAIEIKPNAIGIGTPSLSINAPEISIQSSKFCIQSNPKRVGIGTNDPREMVEIKDALPVISFHQPNVATYKIGT